MPYFMSRRKGVPIWGGGGRTNMANEVVRQKAVEQTVEDMNEWVNELHAEINDAKIAVKASGREAKSANDKLDKVTSIAHTRLALLKDLKLR